ncbi:MAG: methylenetetrahydrofolate reductase [NAD(P)H] [Nannocystaceae bacterium]
MRIKDRLAHKRPVFSFEFFPPKTEEGEKVLWRSLEQLALLEPDFVSVTYGAGGSTRTRTVELVGRIKRELGIEPMAHLTCVGATRDELADTLDRLGDLGIENILALRGDPPRGETRFVPQDGGFRYASDLVRFIRGRGDFCVGAACYPETHPEAASSDEDLGYLKCKVDAGADFLITQMFFDNQTFFEFSRRATGAGIRVPILPGILPVTNVDQLQRIASLSGATIPADLTERLEQADGDPHEVFWTGVATAAHQCRRLLEPTPPEPFVRVAGGVPGIHFYTVNRSPATRAIFEILRLTRAAS